MGKNTTHETLELGKSNDFKKCDTVTYLSILCNLSEVIPFPLSVNVKHMCLFITVLSIHICLAFTSGSYALSEKQSLRNFVFAFLKTQLVQNNHLTSKRITYFKDI